MRRPISLLLVLAVCSAGALPAYAQNPSFRLPADVLPQIGAWFCHEDCFEPDGYRKYLDMYRDYTPYSLITTSFRAKPEITSQQAHDQVKKAVAYARECGLRIALDLDVRLARDAFRSAYPTEQQEMLRLRTADLADTGEITVKIASEVLNDHMTGGNTPYLPLSGRLVRVYSYVTNEGGVEPGTVEDITNKACTVRSANEKEVQVAITCGEATRGRQACVMVAFTHFTPDVFSPHLLEFQRGIVKQYADVELSGEMKDEWGFPPCFDGCPEKNDFWYSEAMRKAFSDKTGGRDLVRDCLLMYLGEKGREKERQAVINHFMEMVLLRNAEIENDYYRVAKETFGPNAFVGTHATWMPYPGTAEFKKNGLDWWMAKRDIGQTDEVTPYCARTALAKKWGSAVWYNQYYSPQLADYEENLWTHAVGGGRINYHPLYPYKGGDMYVDMLRGDLLRADCRIRLLNFVSKSPVDCPVAVVFGHRCATNWAGPAYDDVGLQLTDRLWREGFYADLIPTSEIGGEALCVDKQGYVCYGPQRYAAVVLYHPEFDRPSTAAFFRGVKRDKTALYRVGEWTTDLDGQPFDGKAALPESMVLETDAVSCAEHVIERLRQLGIQPHSPAMGKTTTSAGFQQLGTAAPLRAGRIRLIDGTRIILAGEKELTGDPIQANLDIDGKKVHIEATGVAAVRLAKDGSLDALAAGGLRLLQGPELEIRLDQPVDVALWHDEKGNMHGAIQDWPGPIPTPLAGLCTQWLHLDIPPRHP